MKFGKVLTACLVLALMLTLAGCSGATTAPTTPPTTGTGSGATGGTGATGTTVTEQGFAFQPAQLEVKVGDTVTFKNEDSTAHIVKIDGKELGSQDPGASVTWTAEKAGSFPYACTIHPSMTGEITVK